MGRIGDGGVRRTGGRANGAMGRMSAGRRNADFRRFAPEIAHSPIGHRPFAVSHLGRWFRPGGAEASHAPGAKLVKLLLLLRG
jgi:hypothetical protein